MNSQYAKYLKYKNKYIVLKNKLTGGTNDGKHKKINIYPCLPIGSCKSTLREMFLAKYNYLGFDYNTEGKEKKFNRHLETNDVHYWKDLNHFTLPDLKSLIKINNKHKFLIILDPILLNGRNIQVYFFHLVI
jgi:hypothetical protein